MRTSEQIADIAAALAAAQGAIEGAKKDSTNPHFKSRYADLASVWDACRAQLSKNGIAVVQSRAWMSPTNGDGRESVVLTRLVHTSGQWIEDGGVPLILGKLDMQGLGSALTYARRYGLMAMVGIAPEDDDGNAASHRPAPPVKVETTAPPASGPVPEGAALIRKTEQLETPAGKAYWQIVLADGETLMTWKDGIGKTAEQACQDGAPVRVQVRGTYNDMGVIQSLARAVFTPPPVEKPIHELTADEIPF